MHKKRIIRAIYPTRIDKLLQEEFSDYSRSFLQGLIEQGQVFLDGQAVLRKSQKLVAGQELEVFFPVLEPNIVLAENLELSMIYVDDDIAVLCKPANMLSHPLRFGEGGTVVNGILYALNGRVSNIGGELRSGIVHRLDRETSGILVVARHNQAHLLLQEQFSQRQVYKIYYAICAGQPKLKKAEITAPLARHAKKRMLRCISPDGKSAQTAYQVVKSGGGFNLLRVRIFTGRTHQIRVHLKSIGLPVVNDRDYGGLIFPKNTRLMLHSFALGFKHPMTGQEMRFYCPFPSDMRELLKLQL